MFKSVIKILRTNTCLIITFFCCLPPNLKQMRNSQLTLRNFPCEFCVSKVYVHNFHDFSSMPTVVMVEKVYLISLPTLSKHIPMWRKMPSLDTQKSHKWVEVMIPYLYLKRPLAKKNCLLSKLSSALSMFSYQKYTSYHQEWHDKRK